MTSTSVHKKLMQARSEFHATSLKKTGFNAFSNYKYFEMHDFLPTILKIFNEKNLCGVVSFGIDIAALTITDIDDGSQIIIESPMSTAKLKACHEVQNLGAVETYIRRYLWSTAIELVENDIIDSGVAKEDEESGKLKESKIKELEKAIISSKTKEAAKESWEKALEVCKAMGDRLAANKLKDITAKHCKALEEKQTEDVPQ